MNLDDERRSALGRGLSGLLRHRATDPTLSIDGAGWASVADVVRAINATRRPGNLGVEFDASLLKEIVEADGRGRYELSPDGRRVRAVTGHSFRVDMSLPAFEPTGSLFFGTVEKAAYAMAADGPVHSRKMKVRLQTAEVEALAVAEARRGGGGPVVFEVDAVGLAAAGRRFELAANGDVLTDPFDGSWLRRIEAPGAGPR